MVIKRIAPLSCARIVGTLYVIVGLIFGAIFSVISLAGVFPPQGDSVGGIGGRSILAIVGPASVVLFPICYGLLGFLTALIGAWLYNVLARMVGGIQVDVE